MPVPRRRRSRSAHPVALAAWRPGHHSEDVSDRPIHVSLQASPRDAASWVDLARRCQAAGFRALLVSDHPGSGPSTFTALAAAATATTTLRLGTHVLNAGVRDPLLISADTATLDVVSGGRAEVGLGAGHTPAEWEMTGRTRPDAAGRVRHLIDVSTATRALLDGRTVPAADLGTARDLVLTAPRPVQDRVPLLIGGNHPDLLRWAGGHADAVGLSGLGRTLPDGHSHTVSWTPARIDATAASVRTGAAAAGRDVPPLEALVQVVAVTSDRRAAVADLARESANAVDDLLAAPYLWIGTHEEIVDQVRAARRRWGIDRWVVRTDAFETAREVIARLGAGS